MRDNNIYLWELAAKKETQLTHDATIEPRSFPRARGMHGALMLMYGAYDDNVHPQNEEEFMNDLIAAGEPNQVEIFPMRKHGFIDPARAGSTLVHRAAVWGWWWRW